jgi:hypothetical protein
MHFDSLADKLLYLANSARMQADPAAAPGDTPGEGQRAWGEFAPPNPPTVTPIKDAMTIVDKQVNTAAAVGTQNYLAGVASPRADPITAGIAAQPAYEAAMRDPNVLKRREAGLRRTNLQEWGLAAETKGASRYAEGVEQSRPKVERFWADWHPKLSQHVARIRSMPNVTPADRKNRMIANLDGLRHMKRG